MKYYFGGGEIKSWRDLLKAENVPTVGLSYMGLRRRITKLDNWKIADNFPGQQVFLDSGAYTINRSDGEYTYTDAEELASEYVDYVQANIDAVSLVSEFDALILEKEEIEYYRDKFYNGLDPAKFMPIWHEEYGTEELDKLCSAYEVVGITQSDMHDTSLIATLNHMVNRYGVRLHGVAITSKEMLKAVAFDSVSSMSWLSPSQYGDTIVWAGKELKRYPRAYKAQARKKHRTVFMDNGFDPVKIEADDSRELLRLSLWSWQQFVNSLDGVTTHAYPHNPKSGEIDTSAVDMQGVTEGNAKLLPAIPEKRETQILPVMGVIRKSENPEDEDSEEVPYVYKRSESMRVCNTCFLKLKCPGFQENANCLYNIPIEVKTKEQLKAVKDALVEMQTQRVLFMQMAEDLEGGYADPNLSSEMDRLARLIKAKEEAEQDTFTMTVKATQSNPSKSFMERTFGQTAHSKLQQLDEPVKADDLIKESEIYEAEIVEPT